MKCTCGNELKLSGTEVESCVDCLNDQLQDGYECGFESGRESAYEDIENDKLLEEIEAKKQDEFKLLQQFYCETFLRQ